MSKYFIVLSLIVTSFGSVAQAVIHTGARTEQPGAASANSSVKIACNAKFGDSSRVTGFTANTVQKTGKTYSSHQ